MRRMCSPPAAMRPRVRVAIPGSSSSGGRADTCVSCPSCSPIRSTSAWLTRLDLPEPEMPVTMVITPIGMRTSRRSRLLREICASSSQRVGVRRTRITVSLAPNRYGAVRDAFTSRSPSGGPLYRTCPPAVPPSGPTSTIQSARRMISRSCSTTNTVLPTLRSLSSAANKASLSAGCRPALGSSSTYTTPNRFDRICVARRRRCSSPAESVVVVRSSDR